MAIAPERLNLDHAFWFLHEKSAFEPVTPYKLAIYLLVRTITAHHKMVYLTQSQVCELSFLLYVLICSVNLSFPEFCRLIREPLGRIDKSIYGHFLLSVGEFRGPLEVLISRDEVFIPEQSRTRRISLTKRSWESQGCILQQSLLGVFIRKLALARECQSVIELQISHQHWLRWLSDERPSTRKDLFGDYDASISFSFGITRPICQLDDDAATLTPRVEEIHLSSLREKDSTSSSHKNEVDTDASTAREGEKASSGNEEAASDLNVFTYQKPNYFSPNSLIGLDLNDSTVQQPLPELLSSARARAFLERQIHLLQVSPEEAMPSSELRTTCNYIKCSFLDLPIVHLVWMLNAIRNRNPVEAEEGLRAFFDWGAIRVNERAANGEIRFTSCDARPLRYAPLLLARLARLFGQRQRARYLLTEAIQNAHSNRDLVCLRLAIVEQAAIESEEELAENKGCQELCTQTGASPSLLLSMWALQTTDTEKSTDLDQENELFNDEEKDGKVFSRQLGDCATLQNCIVLSKKCEELQKVATGLQTCAGADYGADRSSQSRLMNEAARIVAASLKLANGFTDGAVSDCEILLRYNLGDMYCKRYNTEAHAIASVNLIYANAMNGRFTAAFRLLQETKTRFLLKENPECAIHWKICESLIEFDRAFLLGNWYEAEKWLEMIKCLTVEEADLRKAIYCYNRGDLQAAFDVIRARRNSLVHSQDLRLKIRCDMVLAMFYAEERRAHIARGILDKCLDLAKSHCLGNYVALITRRLAYVDMLEGKYDIALSKIADCEWIVNTRCSLLEKGHFATTSYLIQKRLWEAKKSEGADSRDVGADSIRLSLLAAARHFYHRSSAPLLEKFVLRLAAFEFNDLGDIEHRDDCAVAYGEMDDKYPANLEWRIL